MPQIYGPFILPAALASPSVAGELWYSGGVCYFFNGSASIPLQSAISGAENLVMATPNGSAGLPALRQIVEADLNLTNNTTANVSATAHGFQPKLSGVATQFLNGQGNYVTPSGASNSYLSQSFSSQTSIVVTHNWGAYPVVQVIDNGGNVIIPQSIVNTTLNSFTVTLLTSTSGTIIATLGSPQPQAVSVITGNYTVQTTDRTLDCTSSGITITLYTAVGNTGREVIIDNDSTGNIYVNPYGSELIQGQTSQTVPPNSAMCLYSNGTNWRID